MATSAIAVGERVQLLKVPQWLVHDLPSDEQEEIASFVGKWTVVTDIDDFGYYWVAFSATRAEGDVGGCSGHSFCVPVGCLGRAG
ncbi:hypothetical protein SAMN02745857_00142 [Andreprevotia lacus DSM 23236]|jgi:hypothetical protein|uniref:Uncharacterized protein n=1 Tax=Andreprevotia lacus DSM 23236 TaxID=1121001 RepID=A0A1W1WXD3_9NEIS|nr:hypothetical protein [Andreprevotia lacus]SMC16257.1 hypothetical protein SAMN02745857_00142 [Andreprevotia lacus DSM 23236]